MLRRCVRRSSNKSTGSDVLTSARDFSVGGTAGFLRGTPSDVSGTWPEIQRYVDVPIDLGFDLGGLKKDSHLEGRGDFYIAAAIDVYAPDVGPFRYLDSGVPGVRVGVRYTTYVLGWESDTTFEIGLIWRWGVPIDLYRHWETRRTGD